MSNYQPVELVFMDIGIRKSASFQEMDVSFIVFGQTSSSCPGLEGKQLFLSLWQKFTRSVLPDTGQEQEVNTKLMLALLFLFFFHFDLVFAQLTDAFCVFLSSGTII